MSDGGQWMSFWVQTSVWLSGVQWVNPMGWKRDIDLPGTADHLEAMHIQFLFQRWAPGLWGKWTI